MSIRLIRQASETPSISNRDDACMIRYAYGGINGVVQNFGSELSLSISGLNITLEAGRAVIDGWEVDISQETLQLSQSSGTTVYEHIYLEINLLLEKASIFVVQTPTVDFPYSLGDDLTLTPSGTARLPLYRLKVSGTTVEKDHTYFRLIPSSQQQVDKLNSQVQEIEDRLSSLGFKEGVVDVQTGNTLLPNVTVEELENYLYRQGNFVYGQLSLKLSNPGSVNEPLGNVILGTLPSNFRPVSTQDYIVAARFYNPTTGAAIVESPCTVKIRMDGAIQAYNYQFVYDHRANIYEIYIHIGFEASPVN